MHECIDFFCGAGGATEGLRRSGHVKVVAAINHDPDALACHEANHPEVEHWNYDIREISEQDLAERYPDANIIWWSAECTHFSIAKGGQSRDADSRMLNDELYRFVDAIGPDYIFIENVKEFLTWGPLDKDGHPIAERRGEHFNRWVRLICERGYHWEYRMLNAADYGARTSRVRMFGVFARQGLPIRWPRQTHAKNPPKPSLLNPNPLKPWRPVRPLLDLTNFGKSIFDREAPLSPNTLRRIEYGLNKYFPAPDGEPYVLRYPTNDEASSAHECDGTCRKEIAQFLVKYHGTGGNAISLDGPASTITTKDRLGMVTCQYLVKQWSGDNAQDLESPMHTITTVPAGQVVTVQACPFISSYYTRNAARDLDSPSPTIPCQSRLYLCVPFILPYSYGNQPQDPYQPLSTIMAKRDKYLCVAQFLEKTYRSQHNVQSLDSPLGTITTVPKFRLISGLLVDWRIVDIRMRMLTVEELLAAQGFPPDYQMPLRRDGEINASKAKKYIGNSVPPNLCELLTHAQFGNEAQRVAGVKEYLKIA